MNGKHVAIAALVVVIALGGVAAALVTGFGPAPGGDEGSAGPSTPYENTVVVEETEASGSGGSSDDGSDGGSAATEAPKPFNFVIEEITECGQTCRDVNGTITNQQDQTAEDVTVRSEIYTDGDLIWSGSSDAGDLGPGETFSDEKRVDLSYSEAYKVQQNDGKIVIRTYVETADGTYVFKQTRTVA